MRVLLVEDEHKLNSAIKRALELQKYVVEATFDGEAGLTLALTEDFDLIILDIMLPKLNGLEICKKLRSEGVPTPIIMLTARGQITDKVNGLDNGADDYMVKPFSFEELFARIRALTRRPESFNTQLLQIRDLILDPVAYKVMRGEHTINLSAKEFALLEYLLRHKNKVVSKDQIITHVWDYDADVLPSTVEVHIKNLRDKVDTPYPLKLIRTVRGFGYEISDEH